MCWLSRRKCRPGGRRTGEGSALPPGERSGRRTSVRSGRRTGQRAIVIGALVVLAVGGAPGAGAAESWSVAAGNVEVRCRMTVGGSFNIVTTALSGALQLSDPAGADYAGELRVDLTTLDSGLDLRNSHLRDTYLEVERGPEFQSTVLSDLVLDDPLPAGAGRHETRFSATLALHGVQRPVEGEADLRRRDGQVAVEATFAISLEAFDIPPPRYLGVGVRDTVEVTVTFDAARADAPSGGTP